MPPTTASPLLARPGAVPVDACSPDAGVALHYGDPVREQRGLHDHAALVDRSNREVLRISGRDRLAWLHSLTTQHLGHLQPGETTEGLVLSPHGHVEHHLILTDDGDATWAHVEPGTLPDLLRFLDAMRFLLRVEPEDVSEEYAVLTVGGPAAQTAATSNTRPALHPAYGVDLLVPRADLAQTATDLGLPLAGMWAWEASRVAAGRPRLHQETDHRTIPHEVGWLETAVHLEKGCYRGQETVARVHNLGRPPRRLTLLHLDGSAERLPAHGNPVEHDGRQVGFVGTAARHYELGPIALALLKRTTPEDATLLAGGVPATQEQVLAPPPEGGRRRVAQRQ